MPYPTGLSAVSAASSIAGKRGISREISIMNGAASADWITESDIATTPQLCGNPTAKRDPGSHQRGHEREARPARPHQKRHVIGAAAGAGAGDESGRHRTVVWHSSMRSSNCLLAEAIDAEDKEACNAKFAEILAEQTALKSRKNNSAKQHRRRPHLRPPGAGRAGVENKQRPRSRNGTKAPSASSSSA